MSTTTTTNYGWTIPNNDELVKDGAAAIRTLGNAADASLKTVSDARGLVHINTTSFTSSAAVSLAANTFSSTYTNYRLIMNLSGHSVNNDIVVRLRAAGSDNSSSVYGNAVWYYNSGASSGGASSGATNTNWVVAYMGSTMTATTIVLEFYDPQVTKQTGMSSWQIRHDSTTTGACELRVGTHVHGTTASYDSATIYSLTGNISGVYSIYGYKK